MRGLHLGLLAYVFLVCCLATASPPRIAKDVIQTVHRVRSILECPDKHLPEDHSLIERQILQLVSRREELPQFVEYVLGEGLLRTDEFYEDLMWIGSCAESLATESDCRARLERLGFQSLAILMAQVSMDPQTAPAPSGAMAAMGPAAAALARIGQFERTSEATLVAQNAFYAASRKSTLVLKTFQYSMVLLASSLGVNSLWYQLGLDQMTPREFVGFLFSVWAGNQALYWIFWERFKWIDPFKKWAAKEEYQALVQHWTELLAVNPALSAQKAGAAATTKLESLARYADAQSDAALDAMILQLENSEAKDESIKKELFSAFLVELEDGNGARAMKILEALRKADPQSQAARLCDVVARIFSLRSAMERESLRRQIIKAATRVSLLAIGISFLNLSLKNLLPPDLVKWRAVPNAIVAGLGVKRILPLVWIPHRFEWLKGRLAKEEEELRQAFSELMAVDPSGEIAQRIAVYDSGRAVDRVVTSTAVDALAETPTGERTRKLWNIVSHELGLSRPSDERVRELLSATYSSQRTCVLRLLDALQRVALEPLKTR